MIPLTRLDSSNQVSPILIHEKEELYESLANSTCKVTWEDEGENMETTGTFIKFQGKAGVLTCFHKRGWKDTNISVRIASEVFSGIQIAEHVSSSLAEKHDICVLNFSKAEYPYFDIGENFGKPKLGEKVYFAGYPLGQSAPIIHKGTISSVQADNFTIDGTVVAGNSGGAVVALRDRKIVLLGVINSQIVDLTEQLLRARDVKLPSIVAMNDVAPSFGDSDVRDVTMQIVTNLLSNLSTGIGKARMISQLPSIFQEEIQEKKVTIPKPRLPREGNITLTGIPPKKQTMNKDNREFWDTGAMSAMSGMLEADPWMQRRLGIGVSLLEQRAIIPPRRVSEQPVMKRRIVEDALKAEGWYLLEHDANHDRWTNGEMIGGKYFTEAVPRHPDIKEELAKKIIRTAQEHPRKKEETKKMSPLDVASLTLQTKEEEEIHGFLQEQLIQNGYEMRGASSSSSQVQTWEKKGSRSIAVPVYLDLQTAVGILRKLYS